ncbi:MAG: hypothetical protein H6893_09420 [Brucellaceae bacterium]|nr:hypothetical protein [Brucellaceae bacterium]
MAGETADALHMAIGAAHALHDLQQVYLKLRRIGWLCDCRSRLSATWLWISGIAYAVGGMLPANPPLRLHWRQPTLIKLFSGGFRNGSQDRHLIIWNQNETSRAESEIILVFWPMAALSFVLEFRMIVRRGFAILAHDSARSIHRWQKHYGARGHCHFAWPRRHALRYRPAANFSPIMITRSIPTTIADTGLR